MKTLHWIKSLGRVLAFLLVFLFLGVGVNAAGSLFEVIVEGDGETAQNGMQVSVHYQGRLIDGTIFDDSQKRGTPFSFTLGSGQVIPGWEQGIAGMKIGEKRVLTIPPELGYGAAGAGGVIPPNATLVFDVELITVTKPPKLADAAPADLRAAQQKGALVIDIRRAEEWAETGIIEGAYTITAFTQSGQLHPEFQTKFTAIVPTPDTPVMLYCRTGNRTGIIGNALVSQLGYNDVTHLSDGIVGWIAGGAPVVPFKP
ncbi:FKBP-type peptidyl-prolyl cis-trans isomerase [Candidatus Puniceispirillum sp.]|nr:FKBP-type peptidyl-prolyl cis-trans isomerase [Candidatus Puniceispirillum sp.]